MNFKRLIVARSSYRDKSCPNRAMGTAILKLECGHVVYFKYSAQPKRFTTCKECERASHG